MHKSKLWNSVAACVADIGLTDFIRTQYYELRLGTGGGQLDYLVAFSRDSARDVHNALVTAGVPWPQLLSLFERWKDRTSRMSRRVPTVWLEFDDVGGTIPKVSVPCVCLCVVPGYSHKRPLEDGASDRGLATILDGLGALGLDARSDGGDALESVVGLLPDGARWIHLSVMLGRHPRAVKLYGAMPRRSLMGYLARIGWAGDHRAIGRALSEYCLEELAGDQLYLDLNLENFRDQNRASLGLALSQQHVWQGTNPDPTRAHALSWWVSAGLCNVAQMRELVTWAQPSVDPLDAPDASRFLDLKLVWQAGVGFGAKAYVGRCYT